MPRKKEFIKRYKGYVIREWIVLPLKRKALIAIPSEASCYIVFMDDDVSKKVALKDIKLYIDATKDKNAKKKN
jgi:hypothetical protein